MIKINTTLYLYVGNTTVNEYNFSVFITVIGQYYKSLKRNYHQVIQNILII